MRLLAALVAGGALLTLNLGSPLAHHMPHAQRDDEGGRQLAARVSYDCGAALLARARRADGVDADLLELAARQFRACLACSSPVDAATLVRAAQHDLRQTESLLAQALQPASAAETTTAAAGPSEGGQMFAGPERLPVPREAAALPLVGPDGVPYRKALPSEDHHAVGKSLRDEVGDKRKRVPVSRPERQTDRSLPLPRVSAEEAMVAPKPDDMRTPALPAPPPEEKMVGPDGVIFERESTATR